MSSIPLIKARHSLTRHVPVGHWLTRHPDRVWLAKVAWSGCVTQDAELRTRRERLVAVWEEQR